MKHHALRLSTLISAAAENKPFLQTIQILAHKLKHEFFLLYEVEFKPTFWYKNTVGRNPVRDKLVYKHRVNKASDDYEFP